MTIIPFTEKTFEIDGVKFQKDILPIGFISGGVDSSLTCKDGKCFGEVYRLFARKAGKCIGWLFRPDYPEKKAIKLVLSKFKN